MVSVHNVPWDHSCAHWSPRYRRWLTETTRSAESRTSATWVLLKLAAHPSVAEGRGVLCGTRSVHP